MHPDAPYFSMLLCLMPDDFTGQVESAATQRVNQNCLCILLTLWQCTLMRPTLVFYSV
jgi:hypothetical protein